MPIQSSFSFVSISVIVPLLGIKAPRAGQRGSQKSGGEELGSVGLMEKVGWGEGGNHINHP